MKPPLIMPVSGAAMQEFELQRIDYAAPEASGQVGGVQAGWPLWLAVWTIGKVGAAKSDEWRSWVAECRGSARTFYGADISRPYPRAHQDGFARMTRFNGSAFDGSASTWSQSIDSNDDQLLTLTGLPSGFILGTGDYVGFKWDDSAFTAGNLQRRALVRIIRGGGGVASSGGSVQVKVEPPIPACVPSGAKAHLDSACCTMRLLSDQTKLDAMDRRLAVRGGTIAAIQDLRA